MSEFLTIGEPIVTFCADSSETGKALEDVNQFTKILGGAELNVAIGVTRLGHTSQYVSQVGVDPLGKFVKKTIKELAVGNDYITEDSNNWTAFQLKERIVQGDPQTFNFRRNSAAAHMTADTIDKIDLTDVKLVHLSGIFPAISMSARKAFQRLTERIDATDIITTFDPNLRPSLWPSENEMITTINELAKHGQIILPGISEGKILMGSDDPETIADFYLQNSEITHTVIVKLGPAGAFVKTKDGSKYTVPGFKANQVVDTVGAGDGFAVGIISALLEGLTMPEAVERANAIGALAVQFPGDNDGYPTPAQLATFLDANRA